MPLRAADEVDATGGGGGGICDVDAAELETLTLVLIRGLAGIVGGGISMISTGDDEISMHFTSSSSSGGGGATAGRARA